MGLHCALSFCSHAVIADLSTIKSSIAFVDNGLDITSHAKDVIFNIEPILKIVQIISELV